MSTALTLWHINLYVVKGRLTLWRGERQVDIMTCRERVKWHCDTWWKSETHYDVWWKGDMALWYTVKRGKWNYDIRRKSRNGSPGLKKMVEMKGLTWKGWHVAFYSSTGSDKISTSQGWGESDLIWFIVRWRGVNPSTRFACQTPLDPSGWKVQENWRMQKGAVISMTTLICITETW